VITDHGHTRDYRQVVLAHAAIPTGRCSPQRPAAT
jgi:hypothetical protein